ncbi:MAG: hypothetical protein ACK4ZM_02430, partial [bacterium]
MYILKIKNLLSQWQKQIEKNDNYLAVKTINEIINTYRALNERERNNLLENFKPLQKKIFSFIYSNDPLVRKHVVNLAGLIDSNELVNDVVKYLKIEKDYDNLLVYLRYIKKYSAIGFISNILEFARQTTILKAKYEAFSVILFLAKSYKDYDKIVEFIFDDFKLSLNNNKNIFLLSEIYKDLINTSMPYFRQQDKPKVESFFYGFYNSVLAKSVELIDLLKTKIEDDDTCQLASYIFVFLLISYHILEEFSNFDNLQNLLCKDFKLADIFKELVSNAKKLDLFLINIINILDDLFIKDQFKRNVIDKELIDYFISLLERSDEKDSLKILHLIHYLDIKLEEHHLLNLEKYSKKVFSEGIINLSVEIFDKNRYYPPVFYFLKYRG